MKRPSSTNTIENPFIKPQNRDWALSEPASLQRPFSPPTSSKKSLEGRPPRVQPETAAVEAGEADVTDYVSFFSAKLLAATQPIISHIPHLPHAEWLAVYQRNQHPAGHHFVIHQHDHPVAGTHYDLRLQCNETSSISFAIMYGLPGDPNSRRLNRNATETRVHKLWNHLIETASLSTGSMLIWDTGEYEVLPFREVKSQADTDGEDDVATKAHSTFSSLPEPKKLQHAFSERKVRLRLHGTRLPQNYTLSLRLMKGNDCAEQPKKPSRKRKRPNPKAKRQWTPETSNSDSDSKLLTTTSTAINAQLRSPPKSKRDLSSLFRTESPPTKSKAMSVSTSTNDTRTDANAAAPDSESSAEAVRLSNAYPGATNSINSIYQRKWYVSLDRRACGFIPAGETKLSGAKAWIRRREEDGELNGFERFHVLGRDVERSAVTGRLAADVLRDEGVEGYVPRGLWKGVTE